MRNFLAGVILGFLQTAYDIEFPAKTSLADARGRLARHVLLTDLIMGLGEAVPSSLGSVAVATSPSGRDLCQTVARNWRLRRDVRDRYVAAAKKIEQSLGPLSFVLGPLFESKDHGRRTSPRPSLLVNVPSFGTLSKNSYRSQRPTFSRLRNPGSPSSGPMFCRAYRLAGHSSPLPRKSCWKRIESPSA